MRIGVIGSGSIGATIAERLIAGGHEVAIANSRGPETLADLAARIGAQAVTVAEAASFGNVVFEAIPFGRFETLPAQELGGKILVDASNYYPGRDGTWEQIDRREMTSSELIQQHLPATLVVKAFNTLDWTNLRDRHKPAGDPERLAVPISGDDDEAKRIVVGLIDQIGFDAVDAGPLKQSARQEPGTPVYGPRLGAEGVRDALASAS